MILISEDPRNRVAIARINRISEITEFGIRRAWFAVGKDLLDSANEAVLRRPRHGRVYFRRGPSGRRRRHVASRPLESHANLSGTLRKSMQWKVRGRDLRFGYGAATANAPEYARFVEEGTSRMVRRPTLRNSIDANRRNTEQHLVQAVFREFGR